MDVRHDISGAKTYGGVRVLGCIIEEPKCLSIRFLGGFGLLGSDVPGGNEHCWVNGNAVIQ